MWITLPLKPLRTGMLMEVCCWSFAAIVSGQDSGGKAQTEPAPAGQTTTAPQNAPPPGRQDGTPPGTGDKAAAAPQEAKLLPGMPAPRKYDFEVRLSLDEAILMGLENNLDVKISRLDDDIRNRELIIAKSVFDPFFNLGAAYAKNRDPTVSDLTVSGAPSSAIRVNPSEVWNYSAGLSGTWLAGTQYDLKLAQVQRDRLLINPAFTPLNPVTSTQASVTARQPLLKGAWFEVNSAQIRIAQNNLLVSREQLELTAMNTVFQIEKAYWEVAFSTQNLEAKTKAYQVALENLENVRKKKAVGTLAAIDVTTAESQAAIRKVDLEDAIQIREVSRDQLLNLINYSKEQSLKERWETGSRIGPFDNIMVTCTTTPSQEPVSVDRDAALAAAFARRPEYKQLGWNVQSQEIRADVAKNELLPSLDLTGTWSELGLNDTFQGSYDEFGSGRFYDWQVGVEFSIPLSNRGPRSRYRNARDELRKLRVNKTAIENQIVLEVDQALRRLEYLQRRVASLDERVRLQTELLRAERRKVDVGMSIAYTVSVIENDLVDNITQALRSKADLQISKAEFFKFMGTLLDRYKISVDSSGNK